MFERLFGRNKAKRDQLGIEVSELGVPGAETTVVTTTSEIPDGPPGMDLGSILQTLREAQEHSGGDREAMAAMLRERFGDAAVTVQHDSTVDWSVMPGQDPIALLATLTELHEKGVVTDEQFEAQKRRLLG